MANRMWQREIMMGGVDPGQFSGSASGHRLQSENLNIGSQVNGDTSGSKRPKWGKDIEGNGAAAAKANEERPVEVGGAVTTPRRRGRPKGSKNKGKSPLSATRDSPNTLKSHVFEIPGGNDVKKTLETYARRRQLGLFILSGNGMVCNVTLRNPAAPTGLATFAGPLQIISISGAFPRSTENQDGTGITVSLADVQSGGTVVGCVMGSLVAFGRVFVMAGTAVDIHQELPNVQPVQLQPRGLFQSSDPTEAQNQTNMMSEIRSLSANGMSSLLSEHRNGQVAKGI